MPHLLALLAEAYGGLGQPETGLDVVAKALTLVDTTEERFVEAELHRLRGDLMLHADGAWRMAAWTPEACLQKALEIARLQEAKSWELPAATSLARLWQSQGKRQEATDLLAPIYDWFTEGFDTADLQEARALIEELRQ